jgi:hypothetical protein
VLIFSFKYDADRGIVFALNIAYRYLIKSRSRHRFLAYCSDKDSHVEITIYYKDREPVGPYRLIVSARRTRHVRFNDLREPEMIPRDTDYSSVIRSDVPVVAQHTRLDSRQANNALLSTVAYPSAA